MSTAVAVRADKPSQVYEQLRALVIRGQLAPGVRVVENDIAERLGVSRTPAREAVLRLFQEGFLAATATTRRTELVVAPLTRDDMLDLYRVMASLEGGAALGVSDLTSGDRRTLARELKEREAEFEAAGRARKVDFDRLFDLHNAFHECLVEACARPRLRGLIATVRPQVERYEWVYAPLVGPGYDETFAEHAAIIKAVREGSGEQAQAAVAANWERGAERLARVIGAAGSRGDW